MKLAGSTHYAIANVLVLHWRSPKASTLLIANLAPKFCTSVKIGTQREHCIPDDKAKLQKSQNFLKSYPKLKSILNNLKGVKARQCLQKPKHCKAASFNLEVILDIENM